MFIKLLAYLERKLSFETSQWKCTFLQYDPECNFLLEFDYNFSKTWGSYHVENLENKTLYSYERSVSFLVLFRVKIFGIRKKWVEEYENK